MFAHKYFLKEGLWQLCVTSEIYHDSASKGRIFSKSLVSWDVCVQKWGLTAAPTSPGWPWWWKWEIHLHYVHRRFQPDIKNNSEIHKLIDPQNTWPKSRQPVTPSPKAAVPELCLHHSMMERTRRKVHLEGTLPTSSVPALQSLFCVKWQQKPLLAMWHHERLQVLHGMSPASVKPASSQLL